MLAGFWCKEQKNVFLFESSVKNWKFSNKNLLNAMKLAATEQVEVDQVEQSTVLAFAEIFGLPIQFGKKMSET